MNKKLLTLIGLTTLAFSLSSCGSAQEVTVRLERDYSVLATDFRLDQSRISLFAGGTQQIKACMLPGSAYKSKVAYKSLNPEVASVDANGVVYANAGGIATIEVTANPGTDQEITKNVSVYVTYPATYKQLQNSCQEILDTQAQTKLTSYVAHDLTHKDKVFENQVTYHYDDYCDYIYDTEAGRAAIDGYQITMPIKGGNVDAVEYMWHLYCNEDYQTNFYHKNGNIQNRIYIEGTSSYIGKARIEPCLDILNSVFTNGKTVIVQHNNIIKQSTLLGYITDTRPGGAGEQIKNETSNIGIFKSGDVTITRFTLTEDNSGKADEDDETNNGIPYGTQYSGEFIMDLTFVNGYCRVDRTYATYEYKITAKSGYTYLEPGNYKVVRDSVTSYDINDEKTYRIPNHDAFIKVDDLLDL